MEQVRRTALHRASSAGHAAAIKLLIEAGANIEALDALVSHLPSNISAYFMIDTYSHERFTFACFAMVGGSDSAY